MNLTSERPSTYVPFVHPAPAFDRPEAVLRDDSLSRAEKREILSSWASDAHAVESQPWLRRIPGHREPVPLAAILAALRCLDDDDDPPPKGGAAIRLQNLPRNQDAEDDRQWKGFLPASRRHHGLARSAHQFRSVALPELRRDHAARAGRAAAGRAGL
jgi:hypothetical protein